MPLYTIAVTVDIEMDTEAEALEALRQAIADARLTEILIVDRPMVIMTTQEEN